MELETPAELVELPDMTGDIARAEARVWRAMLDAADSMAGQYRSHHDGHVLAVALRSIVTELSVATGWSEAQIDSRLAAARRLRDCGPKAWAAFGQGRFDAARATEISRAFDKLSFPASHALLDDHVVGVAERGTLGQVRNWLRVFLAEVEPELAAQRAAFERADRHVRTEHGEDGMAWVSGYVPSIAAAAIDRRLDRIAREMDGDERTLQQRRADLFVSWLTSRDGTEPDIAVTVPVEVLAGVSSAWAVSADERWTTPASWLLDDIDPERTLWHRLVTAPEGGLLDYATIGYHPTDTQRIAVEFRDRVCQAPGCVRPARSCDLDHRVPYPEGPTAAENLQPLCRRHHRLKSHGFLRWSLPSGQAVSADVDWSRNSPESRRE